MKKLIVATTAILLAQSSYAFAQQQTNDNVIQQKLEQFIGRLIVENTTISTSYEALKKENLELKKKLEDKNPPPATGK